MGYFFQGLALFPRSSSAGVEDLMQRGTWLTRLAGGWTSRTAQRWVTHVFSNGLSQECEPQNKPPGAMPRPGLATIWTLRGSSRRGDQDTSAQHAWPTPRFVRARGLINASPSEGVVLVAATLCAHANNVMRVGNLPFSVTRTLRGARNVKSRPGSVRIEAAPANLYAVARRKWGCGGGITRRIRRHWI